MKITNAQLQNMIQQEVTKQINAGKEFKAARQLTVGDMIAKLQTFNPNAKMHIDDGEGGFYKMINTGLENKGNNVFLFVDETY